MGKPNRGKHGVCISERSSAMSASGNAQAIFDSIASKNEEIGIEDFMTRLHDFGHSDQDILRLFEFMDTDNSSTIDRDEFIKGYKQYLRSTGTNLGQEWRLWNQLDQRDEEDRLKMAKLFMVLDDVGTALVQCDVEIERDHAGLTIAVPLQPGTATDLRRSFMSGMPLAPKYAIIVVKEAIKVFSKEANVVRVAPPTPDNKLTIVGDLHGSLSDLNCILDEIGTPSATNRVIFNGDFVDRGKDGVEVLLVLLAYKVLHPTGIHLNRGNHEDVLVNQSYGFMQECVSKYDKNMFGLIIQMFKTLPLCCVVGGGPENGNKGIFVVHGGLFSDPDTTLDTINAIERKNYSTVIVQTKNPSESDILIEEMLWSDPTQDGVPGVYRSERGSGIEFGPDVSINWLQKIGCNYLVRSHECIEDGCEVMPAKPDTKESKAFAKKHNLKYQIYTVFSASNYSDGDNQGAVLTFSTLERPKVFRFRSSVKPPDHKLTGKNRLRLADMLFRRHYRLLRAFEVAYEPKKGILPAQTVCGIFKTVLGLDIKWPALLPSLVGNLNYKDGDPINYVDMLSRFSSRQAAPVHQQATLSQMYDKFSLLKKTFDHWDVDNDGKITIDEFTQGVAKLNEIADDGSMHLDANELFSLVDLDSSGEIDINEFCEAFRLSRDALVGSMR